MTWRKTMSVNDFFICALFAAVAVVLGTTGFLELPKIAGVYSLGGAVFYLLMMAVVVSNSLINVIKELIKVIKESKED